MSHWVFVVMLAQYIVGLGTDAVNSKNNDSLGVLLLKQFFGNIKIDFN